MWQPQLADMPGTVPAMALHLLSALIASASSSRTVANREMRLRNPELRPMFKLGFALQ